MTVIARDKVAGDHLVYAWPFPIGPECEVSCADDEQVVMCPGWVVGDRLGPGRHLWRTPDPTRPVAAFFVLTSPVEVSFDMVTQFLIPATGQPVRLRAIGALQVRCADPALLIAQFVGLPFDNVNDGLLRSVSRSVERMLGRLLTRRVVMAGTPYAVMDPSMLAGIIEELVAYNPTAGAVFGIDLIRMGHLAIAADDGSSPYMPVPQRNVDWSGGIPRVALEGGANGNGHHPAPAAPEPAAAAPRQHARPATGAETVRGMPVVTPDAPPAPSRRAGSVPPADLQPPDRFAVASGEITPRAASQPSAVSGEIPSHSQPPTVVSGEIGGRASSQPSAAVAGEINPRAKSPTTPGVPAAPVIPPVPRRAQPMEVPTSADEITQPGVDKRTMTPIPGSVRVPTPSPNPAQAEPRGAIMGIGMGAIGGSAVAGEIPTKVAIGARVLVPGPNGLMQSATVRQLMQGYYELEVGHSGETIWVPMSGVVPE